VLSVEDRIRGGLWGLLIGDALGVPYEFHPAEQIPPPEQIEFEPPAGFKRAHRDTPPGTWSDDGAQALALLDSLLQRGELDPDDLGRRLLDWYDRGRYAVDGRVFDVGIQTLKALDNLREGVPAIEAGPSGERENGNGSLMRVLPLALWHTGSDAELVTDARRQSLVTHGHLRSQVACALYCLWARRTLEGVGDAWAAAVDSLRAIIGDDARVELETQIRPDAAPKARGTGYVVDCLHSARLALQSSDYISVVRAAIRLGEDTDTTACVAGGIAGLRDGLVPIPSRWRDALRGRELVDPLISACLRRRR
jgi:ADP-ribosylglycohydrolase